MLRFSNDDLTLASAAYVREAQAADEATDLQPYVHALVNLYRCLVQEGWEPPTRIRKLLALHDAAH